MTTELPLGDDAISLVRDEPASLGAEQPVEAYLDDGPVARRCRGGRRGRRARHGRAGRDRVVGVLRRPMPSPTAKPAKKRGRASVPRWDEIMFGGGKSD